MPPQGYTKIARIILAGNQSMKNATKLEIMAVMKADPLFQEQPIVLPADTMLVIVNDASGSQGYVVTAADLGVKQ
jgi:hypothetical protein